MSEYVALHKYHNLQEFIHEKTYPENAVFNNRGSIHRSERLNLKCPQCGEHFLIYPLKIIKYKDELCPHCNGRKKSLKRPLSETPYGKYFSINNEESSNFVSSSSNTKYEWECEEGHTWYKTPHHMSMLDNYCTQCYEDKKLLDNIENNDIIQQSGIISSIKYYDPYCGHIWTIDNIIEDHDTCPFCRIKLKIKRGVNNLFYTNPELQKDWSRKNKITPSVLTRGSRTKVIWECHECHYEWVSSVKNRALLGRGCSSCRKVSIVRGKNDVITLYPKIIEFWDFENNKENIYSLSQFNQNRFHWKCNRMHSFVKSMKDMCKSLSCPVCDGTSKTLTGINDLVTTDPEIVQFWDYEKNSKSPHEVKSTSGYDAWWICEDTGKSFQRDVYDFVHRTRISPYMQSSQGEKDLFDYIKSIYDGDIIQHSRKIIAPLELDIYLPDIGIAFEFNGIYWHSEAGGKDKYYHYNKWKQCKDKGIQLISIWEDDWNGHRDFVISYIDYILGIQDNKDVAIRNVSRNNVLSFMHYNDLEFSLVGDNFYGAYDNDNLVSIASWGINGNSIFINDYYCIPGYNFTFLDILNNIVDEDVENIENIVFIDNNDISYSKEFEVFGFQDYLTIPPSESYIYKSRRYIDEEINNSLMDEDVDKDNLLKIWDCGATMYSLSFTS